MLVSTASARPLQPRVFSLRVLPSGARMRATPPVGPEPLAGERLIHEPEHGLAVVDEADQRPPERAAHDEGARSVDRIHDPLVAAGAPHGGEFLAEDAVIREALRDGGANGALGSPVGGRYRVDTPLPLALFFTTSACRKYGSMAAPERSASLCAKSK